MGSSLTGLRKNLTWNDFRHKRMPRPAAGESGTAAHTSTSFSIPRYSSVPVAGTRPPTFRLADEIVVAIRLKAEECWVASWVLDASTSTAERARLLKHEQGHYDIVALLARDMFTDIMAVKKETYATAQEPLDAVSAIVGQYTPQIESLQVLYDDRTNHGLEEAQQTRWNGLIARSFTEQRASGELAPGGVPYKTPLIDVLKDARVLD